METKPILTKEVGTWYETHIEEPIREIVKVLRDNGINTECSCGHEPRYIQCQLIADGILQELDNLLFNYFSERRLPINYVIEAWIERKNGMSYPGINIKFPLK